MPIATPDANQVAQVQINGFIYTVWETLMVQRQLNDGCSIFEITIAEGSYGPNFQNLKVYTGDTVSVTLDGQLAFTGTVAIRKVSYDDKSHTCTITGRGLTSAAVDSSAKVQQGTNDGSSFQQTATALVKQVGVTLKVINDGGDASTPFTSNVIHYGETIAENISRLASSRALFLTEDVDGSIVAHRFDSSAASSAQLVEGKNILSASVMEDNQSMSGSIVAASQIRGTNDNRPRDQSVTVTQAGGLSQVFNLFISEHPLEADQLKLRAQHENVVQSWALFECNVTTFGWTSPSGVLWSPLANQIVSVYSPMLFPDAPYSMDLAVRGVTFRQDSAGGSTTALEMTLPRMLSPAAAVAAGPGGATSPQGKDDNTPAKTNPPDDQAKTDPEDQERDDDQDADAAQDEEAQATASKQSFPKDLDDQSFDVDADPNSNGTTKT